MNPLAAARGRAEQLRRRAGDPTPDDAAQLVITDNGVGAGTDPHGHNIDQMSNLASGLGGDLEWGSPPGGGTQLTMSVPYTAEAS